MYNLKLVGVVQGLVFELPRLDMYWLVRKLARQGLTREIIRFKIWLDSIELARYANELETLNKSNMILVR